MIVRLLTLAVKAILSNPPTANFSRGALELSAAPISKMLLPDEIGVIDHPSAIQRTYSSASESTMSPNSSMDSMQLRNVISPRGSGYTAPRNLSTDSVDSRGEMSLDSLYGDNQTTVYPDTLDNEDLFSPNQRSRNSSTSSEDD